MPIPRSYLFVTWDGGGNVPAVLGVARRLAARGHAVHVLTEPSLEGAVIKAGAAFIPFTRHFVRRSSDEVLLEDWRAGNPLAALKRQLSEVLFGPAGIVAEETRNALEDTSAEVLSADLMMPGALVAAEALGIPRVVLFHTPEYLPGPGRPASGPGFLPRTDLLGRARDGLFTAAFMRVLAAYVPAFDAVRRAHGLAPHGSAQGLLGEYHRADLRLLQTSEAFDFPIAPRPPNVRYVGPVLDDPNWAEPWQSPWPEADARPLVVASLSTTFQNQRETLEAIVRALGTLEVRALVTLGPAMQGTALDLPPNVIAVASAAHAQVFPHASLIVTHAGHGTVMRSLAHGVPLLCLPMGRDQNDNAARVMAHGAGLRLKPSASPEQIGRAARLILTDARYKEGARLLQNAILADVAAQRDVVELEAVGLSANERVVLPFAGSSG